ncbi:MAG: LicD family protein [Paracoccaceae bacterium]
MAIGKHKTAALLDAVETTFDALNGSYANLYWDSTLVDRPLALSFSPRIVQQIVIEWSAGSENGLTTAVVGKASDGRANADVSAIDLSDVGQSVQTSVQTGEGMMDQIVLELDPPTEISHLQLKRRMNHAVLPPQFKVSLVAADGRETVHDEAAVTDAFWQEQKSHALGSRFPRLWRLARNAIQSAISQDYEGTRKEFSALRKFIGAEAYTTFGAALNSHWLLARHHEFGQHGVSNTFRFWSDDEKKVYLTEIRDLCQLLKSEGIESCVCFGTLLGFVRDDQFIPHDDDADILCFNMNRAFSAEDFIAKISQVGESGGMKVIKESGQFIRMFTPTGRSLDFFVCDVDGQDCHLHPAKHKPTHYDTMFPMGQIQQMGITLPSPNLPENLLRDIYGEGWVTPVPFFEHKW